MTLDLRGKKVVVIGGKQSIGRAIAEAVAREGADAVVWLRRWNEEASEAKVIPIAKWKSHRSRPMEQRQPRSGAKQRRANPTGDPVGQCQNLKMDSPKSPLNLVTSPALLNASIAVLELIRYNDLSAVTATVVFPCRALGGRIVGGPGPFITVSRS